jgi:putative ABC transport system substrate-binding protein
MVGKRLELCHQLVPAAPYLAFLVNPANPGLAEPQTRAAQRAAEVLGRRLLILNASSPEEIEVAFETLVHQQAGALVVSADALYSTQRHQLVALELRYAIPAVHALREDTAAGALGSYGSDRSDEYRLVGTYVGRILKGERPADLPVVQPTKAIGRLAAGPGATINQKHAPFFA